MDNCKLIGPQLELPEPIIQHIQSFLNGKESAASAILSKSWYNSWLTNPNLDFYQRHFGIRFPNPQGVEGFWNFVKTSIERYHNLNLNLESFKIRTDSANNSRAKLIAKAVKMCVDSVDIEFMPPLTRFPLPNELLRELFGAESPARIFVTGCKILDVEVKCARLKSLSFSHVYIEDDTVKNILLGCPLLENLSLSDCEGLVNVNVSKMVNLERFTVIEPERWRKILIVEFEPQCIRFVGSNVCEFQKLSYLLLEQVKIDGMLFSNFSKKFPCIKDLIVKFCKGCVTFDISSRSLKNITLVDDKRLEIRLDVPNIRKFKFKYKFSGSIFPSLSVMEVSREWESDIEFYRIPDMNASWFLELNRFLTNLGSSRIYLTITLPMRKECALDTSELPSPMCLENLTLTVFSSESEWSDILHAMFCSFRPKTITPSFTMISRAQSLRIVYKKLIELENSNCCSSSKKKIAHCELEVLGAEYFEVDAMQWLSMPWKNLLHGLFCSEVHPPEKQHQYHPDIRFQLRWGTNTMLKA